MVAGFVAAALVLALVPGPGVVYIVGRTLAQGRAAGVASVLGVACGNFGNAVGAALGLAVLFGVAAWAQMLVKLAGAAYLVWLGVRTWRAAPRDASRPAFVNTAPRRLFRDGAIVALLNPKTALFFAAFLPQFMRADAPALPQALALGAVFVGIAACTDMTYVMLAASVGRRLGRGRHGARWSGRVGGAALVGLGIVSAWGARVPARAG